MQPDEFSRLFPRLYHLTFASNLESLRTHGLHSSASLADLYQFSPEERDACLTQRRRCLQDLHGVTLRDQLTAPESKMKTCLVGVSIPDWLALLNSKIFFSVTRDRVDRLLAHYAAYPNLLLTVDTAALLCRYSAHTSLCRFNSGSFLFVPTPRGRDSFIPFSSFHYVKKRNTPAELTVDTPIPDIFDFATCEFIPSHPA